MLSPRRATWRRWCRLSGRKYSLLRGLEYERIRGLRLQGYTLDIGGGQRSSYSQLLKVEGTLESINIDPTMQPTILADLDEPLPLGSAICDNVISLNTLEHIRNDVVAVSEMIRVLKPGGHLHIVVPFLYRIHVWPGDYHRHTAAWWVDFLLARGLEPGTLIVEPFVWDPLSSAFSLIEFQFGRLSFLVRGVGKRLVMLFAVLRHGHRVGLERVPAEISRDYAEYALGYYIHGTKR